MPIDPGSVTVIAVPGAPDRLASRSLRRKLDRAIEDPHTVVVVNLSTAAALDSTVLALLVRAGTTLRRGGRILRIALENTHVRRMLAATMLDRSFVVCATVGEAMRPAVHRDESG